MGSGHRVGVLHLLNGGRGGRLESLRVQDTLSDGALPTPTQNKHALVNQASYWEEEKILNNKLPVQFLPKLISNLIYCSYIISLKYR